jgi:endonuclease YncB( thermonuclease family)
MHLALLLFAALAAEPAQLATLPPRPAPQPALVLPCTVARVIDGDTLTVTVTLTASLRLIDCWAPELDQPGGPEARERLTAIAAGRRGLAEIPIAGSLARMLTLNRILARLWIDGRDVGAQLVDEHLATPTKPKAARP